MSPDASAREASQRPMNVERGQRKKRMEREHHQPFCILLADNYWGNVTLENTLGNLRWSRTNVNEVKEDMTVNMQHGQQKFSL